MKPRVMMLVVFTSICGLMIGKGDIHPFIGLTAIICISMGAGSAAAFNMWYDRDIDSIMKRTKNRPLVVGNVFPEEVLSFSIILGFFSIFLMALCVNFLAAFLLAISILYYALIYTIWLKRTSIQNVVIGGVAGALPPLIGTVSVDNSITIEGITLFSIIFLWTPPHSWALALYRIEDYKSCHIPMMPIIKGNLYTKYLIFIYSIFMVFSTFIPFYLDLGRYYYLSISSILGILFIYYCLCLFKTNSVIYEKKLFIYSIYYLFIIFLMLLINPIFMSLNCNFKL